MRPYTFAVTVFRLVAVGLALWVLYSWVQSRVLLPAPEVASATGIEVPFGGMFPAGILKSQSQSQSTEALHQMLMRSWWVSLGFALFIFVFAPVLARVVVIGNHD